jgi:hypothetical protein
MIAVPRRDILIVLLRVRAAPVRTTAELST